MNTPKEILDAMLPELVNHIRPDFHIPCGVDASFYFEIPEKDEETILEKINAVLTNTEKKMGPLEVEALVNRLIKE